MHHLGVPTTRALSLCLTGEKVMRDMFYNGNPKPNRVRWFVVSPSRFFDLAILKS